jgi:drug/metabolite transporter (DMT)-like permease
MNIRLAYLVLIGLGGAWGFTIPMSRIAVSTGNQAFGLIFWQLFVAVVILGALRLIQGRSLMPPRMGREVYIVIALIGTILPNAFSYRAAAELPAGVMAINIALVPLFALPIALFMGYERLDKLRIFGVVLGAIAIAMLVGPSNSLPDASKAIFVLVALAAPLFYGLEGNYLTWRGNHGLNPFDVIYGASLVGLVLVLPLALGTGQFMPVWSTFGVAEGALLASSLCHLVAYIGYVWLIGYAGAVFAAQVAYLVTGAGVVWSMVLLGESYSIWVWLAMAVIMVAVTLVQPRAPLPKADPVAE